MNKNPNPQFEHELCCLTEKRHKIMQWIIEQQDNYSCRVLKSIWGVEIPDETNSPTLHRISPIIGNYYWIFPKAMCELAWHELFYQLDRYKSLSEDNLRRGQISPNKAAGTRRLVKAIRMELFKIRITFGLPQAPKGFEE